MKGLNKYVCPECKFTVHINYKGKLIKFVHMGCKNEQLVRQDDDV